MHQVHLLRLLEMGLDPPGLAPKIKLVRGQMYENYGGESKLLLPEIRPLFQWKIRIFIGDILEGRILWSRSLDI